jgi:probable phosphoglycerate mutase
VVPGDTPGESIVQVAARADAVLRRVAPVLAGGGDVALVGHGHALRIVAARYLGQPAVFGARLRLDAGTVSRLGHEHGAPCVHRWNVPPHLPG